MKLNFSKLSIVVFGDVMLDEYWLGYCDRISPEAPVPVVNINNREIRLGGAANVALNCVSLGAQVTLVGSVGDDQSGESLRALCKKHGIISRLIVNKNASTTKKTRIISGSQQVARCDFECDPKYHEQQNFDNFEGLISQSDIILVSDYAKGFLHNVSEVIQIANDTGKKVLVDPKRQNHSDYSGAFLLTPNMKEFEGMTGLSENEDELEANARSLIRSLDLQCLLLTRGAKGMTLFQKHETHSMPTAAKEVFDVSGAGDTVLASLACALSVGLTNIEAARFSNQCASIAVSKFGTSPVSSKDLDI